MTLLKEKKNIMVEAMFVVFVSCGGLSCAIVISIILKLLFSINILTFIRTESYNT